MKEPSQPFLNWYKEKSKWYSEEEGFAGAEFCLAWDAWQAACDYIKHISYFVNKFDE